MPEHENHFQRAHALSGQAETDALFHGRAATCDAEFRDHGDHLTKPTIGPDAVVLRTT